MDYKIVRIHFLILVTLFLAVVGCKKAIFDESPATEFNQQTAYVERAVIFPTDNNAISKKSIECSLNSLKNCSSVNELFYQQKKFVEAVHSFVGDRQKPYLGYEAASVGEQIIAVLGGPPDESARVGPYYKLSACRYQSCAEKGIGIFKPNGDIVALGIFHWYNSFKKCSDGSDECKVNNPDFDVYYIPTDDSELLFGFLQRWAEEKADNSYVFKGAPKHKLNSMNLINVDRR